MRLVFALALAGLAACSASPPPTTTPSREPTSSTLVSPSPSMPPRETPSLAPSYSPAPPTGSSGGLSEIEPGLAYQDNEFVPTVEYRNNVLDEAVQQRVLDEASSVLATVTGDPYAEVTATFICTGSGLCELKIVGSLGGAPDPDVWWFNLGNDAAVFEMETSETYAKTIWWSVPQDAIDELATVISGDPAAAERAASYTRFDHAGWSLSQPTRLTMTYSSPSGYLTGPPVANATTNYLTITIDISSKKVVDYGEMQLDG